MSRVPWLNVKRPFSVRSRRAERKKMFEATFVAKNRITARMIATVAMVDLVQVMSGSLGVDGDDGQEQPQRDERAKEDQIAEIDDALHDGVEMGEEAERGDGVDDDAGRPALEETEYEFVAGDRPEEAN